MVVRSADAWADGRLDDNDPLTVKLQEFLEELLAYYGKIRCQVAVDEESESQSDDEY